MSKQNNLDNAKNPERIFQCFHFPKKREFSPEALAKAKLDYIKYQVNLLSKETKTKKKSRNVKELPENDKKMQTLSPRKPKNWSQYFNNSNNIDEKSKVLKHKRFIHYHLKNNSGFLINKMMQDMKNNEERKKMNIEIKNTIPDEKNDNEHIERNRIRMNTIANTTFSFHKNNSYDIRNSTMRNTFRMSNLKLKLKLTPNKEPEEQSNLEHSIKRSSKSIHRKSENYKKKSKFNSRNKINSYDISNTFNTRSHYYPNKDIYPILAYDNTEFDFDSKLITEISRQKESIENTLKKLNKTKTNETDTTTYTPPKINSYRNNSKKAIFKIKDKTKIHFLPDGRDKLIKNINYIRDNYRIRTLEANKKRLFSGEYKHKKNNKSFIRPTTSFRCHSAFNKTELNLNENNNLMTELTIKEKGNRVEIESTDIKNILRTDRMIYDNEINKNKRRIYEDPFENMFKKEIKKNIVLHLLQTEYNKNKKKFTEPTESSVAKLSIVYGSMKSKNQNSCQNDIAKKSIKIGKKCIYETKMRNDFLKSTVQMKSETNKNNEMRVKRIVNKIIEGSFKIEYYKKHINKRKIHFDRIMEKYNRIHEEKDNDFLETKQKRKYK